MKLRMVFGFLIFFSIYSTLTFYIGWNGWVWLETSFSLDTVWVYGVLVALFANSYLAGRSKKRFVFFTILGSYWFGILQYALLIFPIANLSVWLLGLAGVSINAAIIWIGWIVLAVLAFIFILGTFNAYSPVVRNYSFTIPKLGGNRDKLRIAMASDMHFGHLSGLAHLRRLVKGVADLKPDIILLPGDIIEDDPIPFVRKKMGDVMKELNAPLGVYGVLGNHEYYGGAIPEFLKEMDRIGIKILMDEVVEIDHSFLLVGRKDKTDKIRQPMAELLEHLDFSKPVIMMDHQPAEITVAEQNGVDLLLSGHTHRGQMAPNHLITRRIFEVDWGYLKKNQLHTIVSSGFGFWGPPLRIGSRSEIVCIDVIFKEQAS